MYANRWIGHGVHIARISIWRSWLFEGVGGGGDERRSMNLQLTSLQDTESKSVIREPVHRGPRAILDPSLPHAALLPVLASFQNRNDVGNDELSPAGHRLGLITYATLRNTITTIQMRLRRQTLLYSCIGFSKNANCTMLEPWRMSVIHIPKCLPKGC